MRVRYALLLLALCLSPSALAGRTAHLFTDEAQLVPEGNIELEQWVWAEGRIPNNVNQPGTYWLWWAPVIGVSSHLELQLPITWAAGVAASTINSAAPGPCSPLSCTTVNSNFTSLTSAELAARYRVFPREDDQGIQPLIRLGYQQSFISQAPESVPSQLNLNLVLNYGGPKEARVSLNAGGHLWMPGAQGTMTLQGTASLGGTLPIGNGFELAGETYAEFPIGSSPQAPQAWSSSSSQYGVAQNSYWGPYWMEQYFHWYAGPSIAWTHGPFWLTAGSLFGLTGNTPRFVPRLLWAVML